MSLRTVYMPDSDESTEGGVRWVVGITFLVITLVLVNIAIEVTLLLGG